MRRNRLRKGLLSIFLTIAMVLGMTPLPPFTMEVQAVTETRTVTFYMDGGASGNTSVQDDWTLVSSGKTIHWSNNDPSNNKITCKSDKKTTTFRANVIECKGVIEFPNLEGTVKSVALTNFRFYDSDMQMYIGLDKNNTSTLLHLQGTSNDYDFPSNNNYDYSNSATFEGSVAVSASNPLKIMFSSTRDDASGDFSFKDGIIAITYDVEVEDTSDPGHTFTFNASGNTLTATCNQTSQYHNCNLGTSRKSTLTLTANDASFDNQRHSATLNLTDFSAETGITDIKTTYSYTNSATSESSGTAPNLIGDYTVTVTIIINSDNAHPYVLTTNFSILAGYNVNNSYSQFSLSKSSALEGEAITITYTQQMDEILEELKLIGATSGNTIPYITNTDGTYTFTMPDEDVNLNATITYPINENDITQNGDTFTIKTADGWDYFCQRMKVDGELNGFSEKTVELGDDITVNTMAGNTDYPFKGTFDGKGHTLTFNTTAIMPNTAPFHLTDGATIRNLHVTGLIEGGSYNYLGGLVGSAKGNLTIENCWVSTQISTTFDSNTLSANVGIGGIVGYLSSQYNQCHITGCVFDGLIYNPNTWNQTFGCGGFVGSFSQYGYAILEDCLFIEGQYDNNGGKHELLWGQDNNKNSTFLHRSTDYDGGTLTNCFYVETRGLKQGSPAVASTDAPTNFAHFGDPTTDYGFLKVYGHTMVFDGKYYTPTYGDLVETYDFNGVKSYNIEYDDKPLGIPEITTPLWAPLLRYKRTFTIGKPATVMLPFDFTKNDLKQGGSIHALDGHFYEFKGIRLDVNVSNKWVPVMSDEVTTMKANTPYIYVPGETTDYWYIENINIFTVDNNGGTKETEYNGSNWNKWRFVGTYEPHYWSETENLVEVGKVYGIAGSTKQVQGVLSDTITVKAGEFTRAHYDAKVRPTSGYFVWTGSEPQDPTSGSTSSSDSYSITLPDNFEIVSVTRNGVKYTGESIPDKFLQDDEIVIRPKEGYAAKNVSATYSGASSTPPEEIPDYDDWFA